MCSGAPRRLERDERAVQRVEGVGLHCEIPVEPKPPLASRARGELVRLDELHLLDALDDELGDAVPRLARRRASSGSVLTRTTRSSPR